MGDLPSTRPAPAAQGTLARTPLVHLLLYALEKRLAGTVEVTSPDGRTASILFVGGRPAKAKASDSTAYLGRTLVDLGLLDEAAHARTLAELAQAKALGAALHGQILLGAGLIGPPELDAGLREQLERKLRGVAAFPPESAYAYFAGFDGLRDWGLDAAHGSDSVPMIWKMLREAPPRAHIDAALERISASPLRLSRAAQIGRLALEKEEAAAVELLRVRPMRIDELEAASGLGADESRLLAYLLLATKQVDVLRAGGSSAAAPSVPPAARDGGGGRSLSPSPPPTAAPRVSMPPAAHASSPRPPPLEAARPPAPSVPPALTDDLKARWLEIIDRAGTIDRADYFSMLDVARDATADEIEAAFFTLAKRWHPDRLPPELAPLRDPCSRVFARMSEARATLVDQEQRAQYMRLLADGSGSPAMQEKVAKVVEAATNFQKAEVCFRRNDFAQAESFCRKALESDPTQPNHHAMLAWLIALKPENQSPEKTRASIQMLDRAIEMSDKCERAYFWRGMLYKRLGRAEAAVRDFKRAVELNPRNIDAAREVRLHRMRGGRPTSHPPATPSTSPGAPASRSEPPKAEEAKSGLFGRFFKKP